MFYPLINYSNASFCNFIALFKSEFPLVKILFQSKLILLQRDDQRRAGWFIPSSLMNYKKSCQKLLRIL